MQTSQNMVAHVDSTHTRTSDFSLSCKVLLDFQTAPLLALPSVLSHLWICERNVLSHCFPSRVHAITPVRALSCVRTCVLMCCSGAVTRLAQLSHNMTMMDRKRQAAKIHRGRPERLQSQKEGDRRSGMRLERGRNTDKLCIK